MVDETTSFLAQSRTFEISPKSGELVEIETASWITSVFEATNTIVDSKYKVLELLGEGGMGAVYRARHLMLDKDMAFKTFRSNKITPEAIERFDREVRAVAKLDSPNIVRVFDSGITENNQPYYTMELLIGQSLEQKLKTTGALEVDQALTIFAEVAEGLKSAHNKGIVHRDLKPANIFLSTQSNNRCVAKIVDFGIAKLADNTGSKQFLTATGTVFGSPLYMSPEQSRGDDVDKRSDIYSFGCALYEALTGHPPLLGRNAVETLILHQTTMPARLSEKAPDKTYPPMLESYVGRLLHKNPEHRPQSFEEILGTFGRMRSISKVETASKQPSRADEEPLVSSKPVANMLIWSVAAVLIACLAVAGIFWPGRQSQKSIKITSAAKPQEDVIVPTELQSMEKPIEPHYYKVERLVIPAQEQEYRRVEGEIDQQNLDIISKSSIRKLTLYRCKFDNVALRKLSRLNLQDLDLTLSTLDDSGAAALTFCKHLERLCVKDTKITDDGIESLAKITSLQHLDLSRTGITDNSLPYLAQMPKLVDLALNQTNVTASGVAKLCERSKSLKSLEIIACHKLDRNQIPQLRRQLHNIQIKIKDNP